MAWSKATDVWIDYLDNRGFIGGWGRDPAGELGTGVGPIISPDGQIWYIIVDNAGNVKTTQVTDLTERF